MLSIPSMCTATHSLIGGYGVDLGAEHDASEEREEKALKHPEEGEDEHQRPGKKPVTAWAQRERKRERVCVCA